MKIIVLVLNVQTFEIKKVENAQMLKINIRSCPNTNVCR